MAVTASALRRRWNELEPRNSRAQGELLSVLDLALKDLGAQYELRPIALLQGEMKRFESFRDKAFRFEKEGRVKCAADCFTEIGDIVRARVTCQTLSDVARLRRLLEQNDAILLGAPVFDAKDRTKTGYRGLHLNAQVEVREGNDRVPVDCEVQIHTALQYAWGLYTHGDFYKAEGVPELVGDLMSQLSDLLNVADELADRLVREVQRTAT